MDTVKTSLYNSATFRPDPYQRGQQKPCGFSPRSQTQLAYDVDFSMVRIVEIGPVTSLADFRQAWCELLRQTPGASFFQSLDWLEVYWRHFGATNGFALGGARRWPAERNRAAGCPQRAVEAWASAGLDVSPA